MNTKLAVIRALSFVLARRVLRIASVVVAAVALLLIVLTWVLAAQLSAWWWLLLIPVGAASLVAGGLLVIARLIAGSLYREPLSKAQSEKLRAFADKIQRLAESRGMGWWLLIFLSIKDLLLHRELRTMIELARDATSLRQDFAELERLLER